MIAIGEIARFRVSEAGRQTMTFLIDKRETGSKSSKLEAFGLRAVALGVKRAETDFAQLCVGLPLKQAVAREVIERMNKCPKRAQVHLRNSFGYEVPREWSCLHDALSSLIDRSKHS